MVGIIDRFIDTWRKEPQSLIDLRKWEDRQGLRARWNENTPAPAVRLDSRLNPEDQAAADAAIAEKALQDRLFDGFAKATPAPRFKLTSDGAAAVATDVFWNEDMTQCPRGTKLQLLGAGGVAVYGVYDGAKFWTGWAPLPKRRVE